MTKSKVTSSNKTPSNAEVRQKAAVEDRLDEELANTFPASDAPSVIRRGTERDPNAHHSKDKAPAK